MIRHLAKSMFSKNKYEKLFKHFISINGHIGKTNKFKLYRFTDVQYSNNIADNSRFVVPTLHKLKIE